MSIHPGKGASRRTPPSVITREWISECPEMPAVRIPLSAFTFDGFGDWASSTDPSARGRVCFLGNLIFIERDWWGLYIPISAGTLTGFCDWASSKEFPDFGRLSFLDTEIVIDMSPEELETHNVVKTEVTRVLSNLSLELDLGKFYGDRTLLRNEAAGLSTEPDGTFVRWDSFESGRARLQPRKDREGQFIQLLGSPDWVLEIVSDSSVGEDTKKLRKIYYRAGILEYWLIDARGKKIVFQILQWRRKGYLAAPLREGWQQSKVFGRSFRLERRRDRLGFWQYTLQIKPA